MTRGQEALSPERGSRVTVLYVVLTVVYMVLAVLHVVLTVLHLVGDERGEVSRHFLREEVVE